MELELRSHRWTDATRRESRSLSSAGRGEALSGTRFTPLSPRSTRCFSHSSCARAHKRDRIWRENPARRFHVRDQNFLSGEVLCRAGAYADRTGQKWVVAVKTSLPVIDYRATFLIPRQFASFPFFLSIEWIDLSYLEQQSRSRSQTKMYVALVMFGKAI